MASAKPKSDVKVYRENTNWANLGLAALAFVILVVAIGYLKGVETFGLGKPRGTVACQELPEHFNSKTLPREISCWRLKMNPNEFSGKIFLPEGVGFTLRWETRELAQIRNGAGEILTIDPRVENDLGINASNMVLQFKGRGAVLIVITKCYLK